MTILEVTVRTGAEGRDLRLRDDLPTGRLAVSIAAQMGKPMTRADGRPIAYVLRRSDSVELIPPGQSLSQARVRSGATLVLVDPDLDAASEPVFLLDRARDAATRARAGGPGSTQFRDAALVFYRDYLDARPDDASARAELQALQSPRPEAATAPETRTSRRRVGIAAGAAAVLAAGVLWSVFPSTPCRPTGQSPPGWREHLNAEVGAALFHPPGWERREGDGWVVIADPRTDAFVMVARGGLRAGEPPSELLRRKVVELGREASDLAQAPSEPRVYGGVTFEGVEGTCTRAGKVRAVYLGVGIAGSSAFAIRMDAPAPSWEGFRAGDGGAIAGSLHFCGS